MFSYEGDIQCTVESFPSWNRAVAVTKSTMNCNEGDTDIYMVTLMATDNIRTDDNDYI